ncbi:MAG: response regulator, partial [Eubacteriales bacterium]|nr:response regulator [Eubacteriales bacterium]
LALSKKLIMQMGGFINVSSVLDEGSEFRFSVPLKVKDESHFVDVKDADNVFVVALIGTPKYYSGVIGQEYQKLVNELGEKLHVSHALYRDFERLKNRITKGNITHCFVGREEYLQHKAYFDNLLEDMDVQVVVMHRRTQEVHVASSVKRLYKPAYALSIVSVLNDENVALNMSKSTTFETDFAASKAKILLVDDNAVNLKVAEGLLRPYRVQITSVASGKAAISKLRDNKYDLVFMDHMMPEMDGVEALRVIRKFEDPYYQDMPVIALTANTTGEARKQLLEAGFQDFVSKPIETKKLEMVLRKWLPEELRDKSDAPSLKQPESEQPVQEAVGTAISKLIDPSVGVSYVGDDMELYREILGLYVEKGPESIAEINDCYEKEKWKDYVICVHALKSASLSIGAVTLSNQAKALELSGKQNNILYIKQHHSEMIESYQETLKQADQMLREESL